MEDFKLDELLKKDKEALDKLKTALEITQARDKFIFEKRKFRTENVRLVAVALLTALISLGSSYFIEYFKQQNSLSTETEKEFFELKKSYIMEKDNAKRVEFACELAKFRNPSKVWKIESERAKFDSICSSLSDIKKLNNVILNTDTSTSHVQAAIADLKSFEKKIQDLKQQKFVASAARQKEISKAIGKLNVMSDSVINKTPEIREAYSSSQSIEKNVKELQKMDEAIIARPNDVTHKSDVRWFKEGYFLYFGDIRVLLQTLDKNHGIKVEICKISTDAPCNKPLLSNVWVRTDAPLRFSDETGAGFKINLEAIDHAGKNPFTLAAYITFETLGRQ